MHPPLSLGVPAMPWCQGLQGLLRGGPRNTWDSLWPCTGSPVAASSPGFRGVGRVLAQYLVGRSLVGGFLSAPLLRAAMASPSVWLDDGRWEGGFAGATFQQPLSNHGRLRAPFPGAAACPGSGRPCSRALGAAEGMSSCKRKSLTSVSDPAVMRPAVAPRRGDAPSGMADDLFFITAGGAARRA